MNGELVILKASDEYGLLDTVKLGEFPSSSSISIAEGKVYIRTANDLRCIIKKDE